MALQKDKDINGATFNYHKIKSFKLNFAKKEITLEVGHFKDKAYRDANPDGNIKRAVITYSDATLYNNILKTSALEVLGLLYVKLKQPIMQDQGTPDEVNLVDINFYTDSEDV